MDLAQLMGAPLFKTNEWAQSNCFSSQTLSFAAMNILTVTCVPLFAYGPTHFCMKHIYGYSVPKTTKALLIFLSIEEIIYSVYMIRTFFMLPTVAFVHFFFWKLDSITLELCLRDLTFTFIIRGGTGSRLCEIWKILLTSLPGYIVSIEPPPTPKKHHLHLFDRQLCGLAKHFFIDSHIGAPFRPCKFIVHPLVSGTPSANKCQAPYLV